jgi:hypothetical protein
LDYYAIALINHGKIPVYGRFPPSRKLTLLDRSFFNQGAVRGGGKTFHFHGGHEPDIEELHIFRRDLDARIKSMKEWGSPDAAKQ